MVRAEAHSKTGVPLCPWEELGLFLPLGAFQDDS